MSDYVYIMIPAMTNQQLKDHHMMDETDQAIERSEKVIIF